MRLILVASLVGVLALALSQAAFAAAPAPPPEPSSTEGKEKLPAPPPAEVLAKITAPDKKPVIKTKQGYTIEIDRSHQMLSVNIPKKKIWISPQVEANQTVEVITDNAPLQQTSTVVARLQKGRVLYTTAEKGDWMQVAIVDAGKVLQGWVQKNHLKPVAEDRPPQKKLASGYDRFASAAMLIQKAKQFDDGLYAAVELAMQNGLGSVTGKRDWIPRLAGKVDDASANLPLAHLYAAMTLAGEPVKVSPPLSKLVADELKGFRADEKRSKPLGFYNWTAELERIFQQDRLLQTKIPAKPNSAAIHNVAKAIAGDSEIRSSYEQTLRLNERLTNKLTTAAYRPILASLDAGQPTTFGERDEISLLPPSRSHEADLIMKLYGNAPIPADFDLMSEVISRLKSGRLSFQPKEDSGWYDHQLWSLEPLVRFDAAAESKQVRPNEEYRKHLEELFKGTYALTRETHIKQLDIPRPAMAAPGERPPVEREKIYIQPDPHVELLPTMYLRRALAYRFVREVLEETFGKESINQMHRLTEQGPVEMNLAAELNLMEQIFSGAYVTACREIGLAEALPAGLGAGQTADEQAETFLRWTASLRSDADLAPDARMMVPVFYDQQRRKLKVWVMLGWESVSSSVSYAQHPVVKISDPDGKPVTGDTGPEIFFSGSYRTLSTPVFAEVYVTRPLNRAEFRRHCDAYQSKAAILANLE